MGNWTYTRRNYQTGRPDGRISGNAIDDLVAGMYEADVGNGAPWLEEAISPSFTYWLAIDGKEVQVLKHHLSKRDGRMLTQNQRRRLTLDLRVREGHPLSNHELWASAKPARDN